MDYKPLQWFSCIQPRGIELRVIPGFMATLAPTVAVALFSTPITLAAAPPEAPPVKDAPGPINQRFANLDAYLAHLKAQSRLDRAWYKEIRPGVFELQSGNFRPTEGGPQQRVFTREELERKFGFAR
jgi:hypothetical protein